MKTPILYRKRIIPAECLLLKDDIILKHNDEIIITRWNTLRPKKDLNHGISCYFLKEGVKVSKFYDAEHRLLCWYCDIVTYTRDPDTNTYIFTDLLADVILYPDGTSHVVDLDELTDAWEQNLLTSELLKKSLRCLDWLLKVLYSGNFTDLQAVIEEAEQDNDQANT